MEHSFWHDRWESGRIGFHEGRPNQLLVTHFPAFGLGEGARVFVPLCGKTLDIDWLLAGGYRVVGAELSELAIRELFERLGVEPVIANLGGLKRFSAPGVDIFVGDIFALTPESLGAADAIVDRAALVALPAEMRQAYAAHIVRLTGAAPQLLICFEYDQSLQAGPPFSVDRDEVRRHYADVYRITELARKDLAGGIKGVPARESAWLLTPRAAAP